MDRKQNLCHKCQQITLSSLASERYLHSQGYKVLVSSAEQCDLCRIIRDGLRRGFVSRGRFVHKIEMIEQIDEAIATSIDSQNQWCPGIAGWVYLDRLSNTSKDYVTVWGSHETWCNLEISSCEKGYKRLFNRTSTDFGYFGPTLTGRALLMYRTSLLFREERDYIDGRADSLLPTRVIELSGPRFRRNIRLLEPGKGVRGVYIALSHRWGSTRRVTTTKENIREHLSHIPFQTLPRTFRDAIEVCGVMEVQYLWIDSLCIIQDNHDDWERESKHMADIFSNAFCTIAAHSANGDDDGFLDKTVLERNYVCLGERDTRFVFSLADDFSRDITYNSSLATRGWTLQEEMLSKRILHFVPSQIYYESNQDVTAINTTKRRSFEREKFRNISSMKSDTSSWFQIVERYSRRELTFMKDKLPGIAGIAKYLQRASGYGYLCGIWYEQLVEGLAWVTGPRSGVQTLSGRSRLSQAPTWSWASIDGPVYFPFRNKEVHAQPNYWTVPDFSIRGNIQPPYYYEMLAHHSVDGSIWIDRPTPLQLRASIIKLPTLGNHLSGDDVNPKAGFDRARSKLSVTSMLFSQWMSNWIKQSHALVAGENMIGWATLDEESHEPQQELWCIPLGWYRHCGDIVLILSRSRTAKDEYRRVGLGSLFEFDAGNASTLSPVTIL